MFDGAFGKPLLWQIINQGRQDDIRADINDKSEVEYIHQQFPGKKHEDIVKAIEAAGPMREDIKPREDYEAF